MGITIADTITLDSGLQVSNTYACFNSTDGMPRSVNCYRQINDGTTTYVVDGVAFIFKDKTAKDENKTSLQSVVVQKTITQAELGTISAPSSKNIYGHLYDQLKSNYSSTTDVE